MAPVVVNWAYSEHCAHVPLFVQARRMGKAVKSRVGSTGELSFALFYGAFCVEGTGMSESGLRALELGMGLGMCGALPSPEAVRYNCGIPRICLAHLACLTALTA